MPSYSHGLKACQAMPILHSIEIGCVIVIECAVSTGQCSFTAVPGARRVPRPAMCRLQRRALRRRPAALEPTLRRERALRSDVPREPCGGARHPGLTHSGAAGAQSAGRHAVQTRQPGHVHQRKMPGKLLLQPTAGLTVNGDPVSLGVKCQQVC